MQDPRNAGDRLFDGQDLASQYLNIAGVILVVLDRQGNVVLLNRKGHEILGYDEGELVGKNWFRTCLPERVRSTVWSAFQQLIAENIVPVEYVENPVLTRSGEERLVAWHNALLRDDAGNLVGTLSSGEDITQRRGAEEAVRRAYSEMEQRVAERTAELTRANEQLVREAEQRKRADESLRQSHDELRAIYDGMVDGLLIADIETKRFLRANASMCRMLGYSKEELRSMSVKDIHPADGLAAVLDTFQAMAEDRLDVAEDLPILRSDGSTFFTAVNARRIVYQGRPCVIGFFRDVTERRRTEETLRDQRRVLKHMLRSSDHERQLIAYDIHDGLAQQITAAIMQFQMSGHMKDRDPEKAAKAFEAGMAMLQQSHFEARRLISGVRPPILDESGIMAAIAHLVHDQSYDRGPKIELRSRVKFDRLAPVLENAIYRIIQECLSNACKHSETEKVRIGVRQRGDRVRIEIRDWGVGFEPHQVGEHCFGLAGIRERARLLGGKAAVRSAPGKGTRITIELPLLWTD